MSRTRKPPKWMTTGAPAYYHAIIDGPATKEVVLRGEPFKSYAGYWVVFVTEVRGYVACEALSRRSTRERK